MDYRTNKAGAILVCFIGEIQAFGTKAMDTSQMEKTIEISLKDILHQLYKRNIGTKNRNQGGHSSGILQNKGNKMVQLAKERKQ